MTQDLAPMGNNRIGILYSIQEMDEIGATKSMTGKIAKQLAATMRENEMLKLALEHYKYIDDTIYRMRHGLKYTPGTEDPNSRAGKALASCK